MPFGKMFDRLKRELIPDSGTVYRELGIRSHSKGIFHKEPQTGNVLGDKSVFWVEPDCLIFNIVFAWEQAVAKTTQAERGLIASHRFPMYQAKKDVTDLDFALYFLKTKRGKMLLEDASPGGAGRNKTLSQGDLNKSLFPSPPYQEQRRIAAILGTWDKAIDNMQALIVAKRHHRQVLLQELLSGRRRFPGFNGKWKEVLVAEITSFHKQGYYTTDKYTVAGEYILLRGTDMHCPRIDHESSPRIHMSSEMYNAFKVEIGDFLVVRSGSIGGYGIVKHPIQAAFASYLIKFQFDPQKVLVDYFGLFYTSHLAKQQLKWITQGSTNVNINAENIKALTIPLPDLEEQKRMVEVLNALDAEIELLEEQRTDLTTQKRGLMQELLTGALRV